MSAATQNEMKRLVRATRAQAELLERVWDYVDERGLAKLGQSKVTALIEAHRQVVAERDALAARYAALADEVRAMIQDSDGLAGYHLNGEVACWSEFEVGHLLSEPEDLGEKVLARLKAEWQAEALQQLADDYYGEINPRTVADRAANLRRQAQQPTDCPGPGKCDDLGCPAHYATGDE